MDAITYAMSKKYTDSKITESTGLHREIVNSLPSTGDNSIIYMVLDPNASSPDVYDEWLWVNGTYEHIGSTRVDLTDYYNKTQIDAALSGKANTATTLSGYGISDAYTKTETDTALSGKANTSDIPTALSGLSDDSTHRLVTDAEKGTWNGKANTATSLSGYGITDAYTKTEVDTALSGKISSSEKGVSNGVAELDANGKIPSSQLPSYVDDTIEGYLYEGKWYSDSSHTHEVAGETEKIYVELSTNKTYRWSGSVFVEISESLALGETSSTAYRGDRGKEAYDHSQSDHSGVTPTFTEASTRANIATGESIATIFGKIKKFFSDLKAVAFTGSYNDLSDKPDLSGKADTATTLSGYGITDAYTKTQVDTSLNDVYEIMSKNGAKNLIKLPYKDSSGTVNNGITFTLVNDTVIKAKGTATADAVFTINDLWVDFNNANEYILNCNGLNGANDTYYVSLDFIDEENHSVGTFITTGSDVNVTIPQNALAAVLTINIKSGQTVSSKIFKPMIRPASDTDDVYKTPVKTNKELTDALNNMQKNRIVQSINISSYDMSNPYQCPEDGYIELNIPPGEHGLATIEGQVAVFAHEFFDGSNYTESGTSVFVRKGMRVWLDMATSNQVTLTYFKIGTT